MLNCMVDGLRHDIEAGEGIYLGSVIDTLSSEAAKSGRFIAALKINGEELDTVSEQCADLALTNISRLEVTTETTANLAMSALTEGGGYLAELRRFLLLVVDSYRSGDESGGGKQFVELVTGLEWFVKVTSAAETLLQVDFADTRCDGRTLTETVESLNRVLLEIIVAQEQRDWVLLTDLLEYELAPQLELWQKIFSMLRLKAAANAGESPC